MEGGDSWSSRLSSSSSSSVRGYKLSSEGYFGGDDIEGEDEYSMQEFTCPFCSDEFDIVGLFCHLDEEHQVEVKNGFCPECSKRVGSDMVGHITMQHGVLMNAQRRRRSRRSIPNTVLSMMGKGLREGNRRSSSGGSSYTISSSPDPDPLLSSFINSSSSAEELGKGESRYSLDLTPLQNSGEKANGSSQQKPMLSEKEHEEKARNCEFVQGLLLSTMLDDIL